LGWIGRELAVLNYEVLAPQLDHNAKPLLRSWQAVLQPLASCLNSQSIIIAHSLGCFLTLRLLEQIEYVAPINKVFLISGFYDAPRESASIFFEPEPEWSKIRRQAQEFVCIYSDDDTIVTPDRTRRLANRLEAELVLVSGKGHFLGSRGMSTFPELMKMVAA
jgi:predicted alpha/beta hydrolase family esterase